MIDQLISELVAYGLQNGLIEDADKVYVTNGLLELFQKQDYQEPNASVEPRDLHFILEDMLAFALSEGILEDDTVTMKDLFDTKIMGILTPAPSVVRKAFEEKYQVSPKTATDFYYHFSQATNYIRTDRIIKDEKWTTDTEFGQMDITINLSKPEKDPRDIAKAAAAKKSGYPACLLCRENEGYAGHFSHPARQNHRIIPITLCGEQYYLQYSPYVYYNEHCIIFNEKHIPMAINRMTFDKLLDFVKQFPHYTAGSNADLPIVGGSILSHDHFQGGGYVFAMAKAPYELEFELEGYPDVHAGIVKWPMSVIRLQGRTTESIVEVMQTMAPEYPVIKAEKVEPEVYRVINAILETKQFDIIVAQAYLQIVLARCVGKLNLVEKSHVGSKDLIYQTVSYISANFKKKLSLEEMAKDLGVSKYVLSRLFSKTFHRNFNQYLNDARLNYACHRLENTSDSITNICLDSGFESQRTFNRVFKERYKISPSDYRSTCLKDMLS